MNHDYVARCENCGLEVGVDNQAALDIMVARLSGTATRESVCGHSFVTYEPRAVTDGGREEWSPEPTTVRDGETSDVTHARRNAEMLRRAREVNEE